MKGEVKLSLFVDNIMLYLEDLKNLKRLFELINEFIKIAEQIMTYPAVKKNKTRSFSGK